MDRTSETDPIQVDFLLEEEVPTPGRLGMTFAPGMWAISWKGRWERDLQDGVAALVGSKTLNRDEYDPSRGRVAKPRVELLVDKTGVGVAVTDLLKARDLKFTAVTIHGGEKVTRTSGVYNVPKGDLVAALEVPFHTGALKVAEGLELWGVLREELQNFRTKINLKTAHASYEHWRESEHDDLVLACALACWGATARRGQRALRLIR